VWQLESLFPNSAASQRLAAVPPDDAPPKARVASSIHQNRKR
jgi:hypothetical protein